jgi:two-component system phosphate regulon sensor histidine kinase PhoR
MVIGVLNFDSRTPGFFANAQTESLEAFADQAAIAIQNARLFEELAAHTEGLETAVAERTTQLNSTTERVEAILDNSPDAILLLDSRACIDAANPAFYRVFDTPVDSYRKQPIYELVTVDGKEKVQDAVHMVAVKRKTMRLEVTARRPDNSTFQADMALAAIRQNGRAVGIVCILRDITESKEVEAMKDQFVSNVSHELRTPIASLKLNHQLLRENPERIDVYLARLGREIDRLNVLVEDILRLSRLDQAKAELELAPVDLNELVAQHVEDRTPIAESRGIQLSAAGADDLPLVQADSTLLGQALSVLLTNALNYTPAGGSILVSTSKHNDGSQRLAGFSVRDSGPGITPEDRAQLFTRFFRGKAGRDSGMPGTGLGLSIANEIVQRHGGRIDVGENKEAGSGAVFSVWLPAK